MDTLPDNLVLRKIQLTGFRKLVHKKLGIKLVAHSTEKLLDYKPLFGFLFEEALRKYTHWGHCDLNIVHGNLSEFITGRMLNQYDKILSRGHLSIYKNTPLVNKAFLYSFRINYKEILANPVYCKFDEWHGIGILFHELRLRVFHEEMAADIYPNSFSLRCMISQNFANQLFVMWRGQNGAYEMDESLIHSTEIFEYASDHYAYCMNRYVERLRSRLQPALSLAGNTSLGNLLGIRLGYQ